ncbi:MAG: 30S ribosomal protein S12 methylthiotransferase RimO [Ignavibacteriales bacterium]|nr:30S ribosomal protein S12 methylthiotransferase RimO [Ignavibacteriales bacterium]
MVVKSKHNGKTSNTIFVHSLGCAKNLVDSEQLLRQIGANEMNIAKSYDDASVVVINTCGFIGPAKEESVNTILEAVEKKSKGKLEKVFVMGCLSERYKSDLQKEIPEVDGFFGTISEIGKIVHALGGDLKYELLGERVLLTPTFSAFLKISEGCDNPCSFCAIPIMRGKHFSKPMDSLLHEADHLVSQGVKELNIIAQDTTYYGLDMSNSRELKSLLHNLSQVNGIEWIRLLYAYPTKFPRDILEEIAMNPKLCKYLDMPIQHAADDVLKSMRRGITNRTLRDLISHIRTVVPSITLRTTFIVGYPNETENDFQTLLNFVEEMEFDRVGVFKYSLEDDTTAFPLGDVISEEEKEKRYAQLMELQQKVSLKKNKERIGKTIKVLIERGAGNTFVGRSESDAPEVDGEVYVSSPTELTMGNFYNVHISKAEHYDVYGEVTNEFYRN